MHRCDRCSLCICHVCHQAGRTLSRHNLANRNDLDWSVPDDPTWRINRQEREARLALRAQRARQQEEEQMAQEEEEEKVQEEEQEAPAAAAVGDNDGSGAAEPALGLATRSANTSGRMQAGQNARTPLLGNFGVAPRDLASARQGFAAARPNVAAPRPYVATAHPEFGFARIPVNYDEGTRRSSERLRADREMELYWNYNPEIREIRDRGDRASVEDALSFVDASITMIGMTRSEAWREGARVWLRQTTSFELALVREPPS
jgi:hypothetical protein